MQLDDLDKIEFEWEEEKTKKNNSLTKLKEAFLLTYQFVVMIVFLTITIAFILGIAELTELIRGQIGE